MRLRRLSRLGAGAAALAVFLAAALSVGWGDASLYPARPGAATIPVFLVSNGYHSGLVLPQPDTKAVSSRDGRSALNAVALRFGHYDWIEAGWGESRFYREVPTIAALNWRLGLSALFGRGNASVVHVVGVEGDPRRVFKGADVVLLELSAEGFARLAERLDRSFALGPDGRPRDLGPGLYGPSLFYEAVGAFSILNLCNHWTAGLLAAAGVPVWPVAATLPGGLIVDLRLRSGLYPEADPLSAASGTH